MPSTVASADPLPGLTGFQQSALVWRLRSELAAQPGVRVITTRERALERLGLTMEGGVTLRLETTTSGATVVIARALRTTRRSPWTVISDPVQVTPGRGITIGDQTVRQWVANLMGTWEASDHGRNLAAPRSQL